MVQLQNRLCQIYSAFFDAKCYQFLGAVGMDISLNHMTEIMSEYKIGRHGYILLLSQNGTFLYHPQSDIIQKNIKDVDIFLKFTDIIIF